MTQKFSWITERWKSVHLQAISMQSCIGTSAHMLDLIASICQSLHHRQAQYARH
jgi:hypothetical protein